jgi:hypothetical protein
VRAGALKGTAAAGLSSGEAYSGGVGPWTEADVERHCAENLTGYDVADVVIERSDGTTVPIVSVPARTDLAFPRCTNVAGLPQEDITVSL